jgi:hypothetical protein
MRYLPVDLKNEKVCTGCPLFDGEWYGCVAIPLVSCYERPACCPLKSGTLVPDEIEERKSNDE